MDNNSTSQKPIALLCQHFYPEMISTGMHMTELSTGLASNGLSIKVYCAFPAYSDVSQHGKVPQVMLYKGIDVERVKTFGDPRGGVLSRGMFSITFLIAVMWIMFRNRKKHSGIIVTTNPPFIGVAAVVIKRLTGLKILTIVYDVYPDIAVKLGAFKPNSFIVKIWKRVTRIIFENSDTLVVIGRDMEKIVRRKLRKPENKKMALIPNWSDEKHIRPIDRDQNSFAADHYPPDHFVVQYSGRMGRTHNLEPLIDAAKLLQTNSVYFQLIGDGAKREKLMQLVEENNLKNVQFLPYQPIENLGNVLSAPDLSVVCLDKLFTGLSVPSKTYGIMASGRPILAFMDSHSEIGQMIIENNCGVVLASPSGREIANIILNLMAHPEKVKEMGTNGFEAFKQNYTLAAAIRRYESELRACFDLKDFSLSLSQTESQS